MDQFRVLGPNRLAGKVTAAGAKNAALPALAASLLSDQPLELDRVPQVQDIGTMLKLLSHLGVEAEPLGNARVRLVPTPDSRADEAPYSLVKTMRASVLVLGPMLARFGRARVSLPGGCAIGARPIDQHIAGLEAMGADVQLEHGYVSATVDKLVGARFAFTMPSVTGTENLMMAACLAKGTTVLQNCACEPEVVDLANLLRTMGAQLEGDGTQKIEIQGVPELSGGHHAIIPDRIEGGTYLIGAAISGGDVELVDVDPVHLTPLLEKLSEIGCEIEITDNGIRVQRSGTIRPRDLVTAPHPGFPTDLQAQYMALMTQADGPATLCETVFENRFQHVPELSRMGARIDIDGSYARVQGPCALSGARVMATDLRASACLVLAGLVAEGETWIERIYHLDRGYEQMESKLQNLGARVERIRSGEPWEPPVSGV